MRFVSCIFILFLGELFYLEVKGQNSCGISGNPSGLAFNATQSKRGAWPWIVAIFKTNGNEFICGGTLVSEQMVITAAHCIQNKNVNISRQPDEIVLGIGRYDISKLHERGSETAYPSEIIIHPKWKYYTENYDGDIAIIILEKKVRISDSIFPICLTSMTLKTDEIGIFVGWGKSEGVAKHENIPRQLDVKVRDNEDCFLKNPRFAAISSKNTFCAGKDEYSGPCSGDSGSGLFIKLQSRWYLRGIVSASFLSNGICDVSLDAIFTNALKFIDWINEVARINEINLPATTVLTKPKREIFCFFESWAHFRQGDGSFNQDKLKPELCTVLVYMLAELEGDSLKQLNWETPDNYKRFNDIKKSYPHLKTLLLIGGWVEGSEKYSKLAADSRRRKNFARNTANYLTIHNFDGFHLHWEYPAHRGGAPEDKQNLVHLLQDLSDECKPKDLILSVTVRVQRETVQKAYDVKNIAKIVDFITLMTFDFHSSSDRTIGFAAPLKGDGEANVESRVNYIRSFGVPAEKLILGVPFFGRTFMTDQRGNIGDETINDHGFAGPFFGEEGFLGYNEICSLRKQQEWQEVKFDSRASQAIGKYSNLGYTHVVTFDTPRSVANKVKFAVEEGLGGIWTWFVDSDDYNGDCKKDFTTFADFSQATGPLRREKDFPLLRTANEAFDLLGVKH